MKLELLKHLPRVSLDTIHFLLTKGKRHLGEMEEGRKP